MNKKLYEKRLEILDKIADHFEKEVNKSKRGLTYVKLIERKKPMKDRLCKGSISKANIHLYGTFVEYKKVQLSLALGLSSKNVLKIFFEDKGWHNLTPRSFKKLMLSFHFSKQDLRLFLELFLFNKNCSWVIDYPDYIHFYNLVRSFKSIEEFKEYLGYKWMSNEDFYGLSLDKVLLFNHDDDKKMVAHYLNKPLDNLLLTHNTYNTFTLFHRIGFFPPLREELSDYYTKYMKKLDTYKVKMWKFEHSLREQLYDLGKIDLERKEAKSAFIKEVHPF